MNFLFVTVVLLHLRLFLASGEDKPRGSDISLWIDEKQVKELSGFGARKGLGIPDLIIELSRKTRYWIYDGVEFNERFPMEIFAIANGEVSTYILDPKFEIYLPIIPTEIESVNFTWRSGDQKYYYDFEQLKSFNESILRNPTVSIELRGKVPKKPKVFQLFLHCLRNQSGMASFGIDLRIQNDRGASLPGTPLKFRLRKECDNHVPDPECDKKCANGGRCNQHRICECPKGYMGKYCHSALCYPQCMNGGTCISPGLCACSEGYIGPHCEGGMCLQKCLNGGKCINKDTCFCRSGYYGARCEYSKCTVVPCLNGGRCVGINKCRCKKGYTGPQCEGLLERPSLAKHDSCKKKCAHGVCHNKRCVCDKGWFGKRCNRRRPKRRWQRKLLH